MKTISIKLTAWSKGKAAMQEILSQIDTITNTTIRANIMAINDNIFTAGTDSDNELDEKQIEMELNRLSSDEVDSLMNEIHDNDNTKEGSLHQQQKESLSQNKTIDQIKKDKISIFCKECKFFGTLRNNGGFGTPLYHCKPLKLNDNSNNSNHYDFGEYTPIWNDFIHIHSTLIETELKTLLTKYSTNKSDVEKFLNHSLQSRTVCNMLPFKAHHEYFKGPSNDYFDLIEHFNSNGNNDLKTFLIIFNGITNMFIRLHKYPSGFWGFDGFFDWKIQFLKRQNESDIILSDLLKEFILNQLAQMGIFDDYKYKTALDAKAFKPPEYMKKVSEFKQKIINKNKTKIKKHLFNNNFNEFDSLMEYCVQDICCDKKNDLKTLNAIEKVYKCNANPASSNVDCGIGFYIINRLSFILFQELMNIKNNNNEKTQSLLLLYPSLIKFFQFMYNFSVYAHCYPTYPMNVTKTKSGHQLYYIYEYNSLKQTIYSNIFSGDFSPILKNFNYFDMSFGEDGTLLHQAVSSHLYYLIRMYLKDGFDCYAFNRAYSGASRFTPFSIAQKRKAFRIVSLLTSHCNKMGIPVLTHEKENKTEEKANEAKEEKDEKSGFVIMDDKSMEVKYDLFMNQYMAAKYLMVKLGIAITDDMKGLPSKYDYVSPRVTKVFKADFYRSFDRLVALQPDEENNDKNVKTSINAILKGVLSLLKCKMVVSQDLLVLCGIYAAYYVTHESNSIEAKLGAEYFDTVSNVTRECLQHKGKNVKEQESKQDDNDESHDANDDNDDDNDEELDPKVLKERNYQWFKMYLLHSNVWLCKTGDKENKSSVLYERALAITNDELKDQKQFIWDNIQEEHKVNEKYFNEMIEFGSDINEKLALNQRDLRQDVIDNGIKSQKSEFDMLVAALKMDNVSNDNFDIEFENNTKLYLTECLAFAHINNDTLQNEMKEYFSDINKFDTKNVRYQSAPVKLYNRCVIKATSDYSHCDYPSSAQILDLMRFSVTFSDSKSLLDGINMFINDINNNNIKCLKPNGVLRIKNGFNAIKNQWKNAQDANYCDIKLNIIYRNIETKQCMIIEAQFLLKFLLTAKKMGHKLYGIVRQSDYIYNITNQCYTTDEDYEKYKFKINKLIERKDTSNLMKQLFWKPSIVLSMIDRHHTPIMKTVAEQLQRSNAKFLLFFVSCLFHFGVILLHENPSDKQFDENQNERGKPKKYANYSDELKAREKRHFLEGYFNYNENGKYFTEYWTFCGISTQYISSKNDILYFLVDTIMKLKCFNGLSYVVDCREDIEYIIHEDNYYYMQLISKYFLKNMKAIESGLNYNYREYPLVLLLKSDKISNSDKVVKNKCQYLKLMFKLSKQSNTLIHTKGLTKAIQVCNKMIENSDENIHSNGKVYKSMIVEYISNNSIPDVL